MYGLVLKMNRNGILVFWNSKVLCIDLVQKKGTPVTNLAENEDVHGYFLYLKFELNSG